MIKTLSCNEITANFMSRFSSIFIMKPHLLSITLDVTDKNLFFHQLFISVTVFRFKHEVGVA